MDEAAALSRETQDPWTHFSITGGEPFLDFPLLLKAVAHGHGLGAEMSCVSNAYWASSDARARSRLSRLKDAGLDLLCLSRSRFHEQFVKRSRVERALRIASEIGLKTHLKFVQTNSDDDEPADVTRWARRLGAGSVQIIPLAPTVREDATVPESEYVRVEKLPEGRCPASTLSVYEDGAAYPCCTPGAVHPYFLLGNVHTSTLAAIRDRFHFGGKHQILRQFGPSYFAQAAKNSGHASLLRRRYGNACDLCIHIARDPTLSRIADDAARAFELQELRKILGSAVHTRASGETSAGPLTQGDIV